MAKKEMKVKQVIEVEKTYAYDDADYVDRSRRDEDSFGSGCDLDSSGSVESGAGVHSASASLPLFGSFATQTEKSDGLEQVKSDGTSMTQQTGSSSNQKLDAQSQRKVAYLEKKPRIEVTYKEKPAPKTNFGFGSSLPTNR